MVSRMTSLSRGRWPLTVVATAFAALLIPVLPARAQLSTVISTSTAVPGLAWLSTIATVGTDTYPAGPIASTTDGGVTWAPARVGEVVGPDPQLRWASGGSGVIASTDGGASWHSLPSFAAMLNMYGAVEYTDVLQLIADPARRGVVYALVNAGNSKGSNVTVVESTDAGATWRFWATPIGTFGSYLPYRASAAIPGRDALLVARVNSRPHLHSEIAIATPLAAQFHGLQTPTGVRNPIVTDRLSVDRRGTRMLLQTTDRRWLLSTNGGATFRVLGPTPRLRSVGARPAVLDPGRPDRLAQLR